MQRLVYDAVIFVLCRYMSDHSYALPTSLEKVMARLNETLSREESMEREKRNAKDRKRRAKNTVHGLLQDLREKNLINEELKERLDLYSGKIEIRYKKWRKWYVVKWEYSPEKAGRSSFYSAPAYSLSARSKGFRNDQTPGPAAYTLPPMLGPKTVTKSSAPFYSLSGKSTIGSFHEDLQKTPGPGTYKVTDPNIYKSKLPQFSMTARNSMPGDTTQKPGPGAHSPEKVRKLKLGICKVEVEGIS
ncbi:ODF3A protein, partial [Polypterus senegalus]